MQNSNSDISVIEDYKSFTEITIEAKRVNKPCEKRFKNRVAMKPITYIFIAEILILQTAAEHRNYGSALFHIR